MEFQVSLLLKFILTYVTCTLNLQILCTELLGKKEKSPFERMTNRNTAGYHNENCVEIAAYLLNSGVSINNGLAAILLLEACHYGNLNAVKLVVENRQLNMNGEFYTCLILLIANFYCV